MFKFVVWLILPVGGLGAHPCVMLPGNESFVCVCNSTYSDSFEPLPALHAGFVYLYMSGRDGGRLQFSQQPIAATANESDFSINVNVEEPRQAVVGFGGALTDAAVINIRSLPRGAQRKLLQMYFSPDQLHYTFIRIPMAASDFSTHAYTYDQLPLDYFQINFHLAPEDLYGKIPIVREAMLIAERRLKLLAGAWAVPSWMKTDFRVLSGGQVRRCAYAAWARYYIRFLKAYEREGLPFWAITNGNEPVLAVVSASWSAKQMHLFIAEYLGPMLRLYQPDVKLLLLDDLPGDIPDYLPLLVSRTTAQYISGWAIHPYSGPGPLAVNLELAHTRFPNKFIIMTELSVGVGSPVPVDLGSWSRAEDYASVIIAGFQHWAVGFIDWNLALNLSGGPTFINNNIDAGVIVNVSGGVWYKQPLLYIITHFSAFIPPGSHILPVTVDPEPPAPGAVMVTAARTPQRTVVIVVLNKMEVNITLSVSFGEDAEGQIAAPGKSITTAIYLLTSAQQHNMAKVPT